MPIASGADHQLAVAIAQRAALLAVAKNLRDVKGRHHSQKAFERLVAVVAEIEAGGALPVEPPSPDADRAVPALDYEAAKDFFYAKLRDDRVGRGRMESAFYHTAEFIFLNGCRQRDELVDRIRHLEACLAGGADGSLK